MILLNIFFIINSMMDNFDDEFCLLMKKKVITIGNATMIQTLFTVYFVPLLVLHAADEDDHHLHHLSAYITSISSQEATILPTSSGEPIER